MIPLLAALVGGPRRQLPFPAYVLGFLLFMGVCYFLVRRRETRLKTHPDEPVGPSFVAWMVFLSSTVLLGIGVIAYFFLPERDEKFDDREAKHFLLLMGAWTLGGLAASSLFATCTAWIFRPRSARAVAIVSFAASATLVTIVQLNWSAWSQEAWSRAEAETRLRFAAAGQEAAWTPGYAAAHARHRLHGQLFGGLTGVVCGFTALTAAAIAAAVFVRRGGRIRSERAILLGVRIYLVWMVFLLLAAFCWHFIELPSGISYNV